MKSLVKRLTALEMVKGVETIVVERIIVVPEKQWDKMSEADRDVMIEQCSPLIIANSVAVSDGQSSGETK
ncbi:hypothetical protein ACFLZU_04515 [Thermodesulfobacteriota bacterium]